MGNAADWRFEAAVTIEIENGDDGRVPVVPGEGASVGAMVARAHDANDDAGASLQTVLTYCAEQRCIADDATCPGCVRRTERDGLTSLDDFVARRKSVTITASGLQLAGAGRGEIAVASLDDLAKTWAGREMWFLARRVIRRRIKAADPRPKQMGVGLPLETALTSPAVILVRPQLAENIGAAARAMANFGLEDLRLVAPRDAWPNPQARAAAAGANGIIDDAIAHATLVEGLSGLHWVCATTARQRDLTKPVLTPADAITEIIRRTGEGQRCGILFGPERTGLEQSEIADADAIVMAPVNPTFASLNLAQAVLLLAYEWIRQTGGGTLGRVTTYETAITSGLKTRSPPATKEQLLGFFEHLEGELDRMGFLHPPHRRAVVVANLRSMFTRLSPSEQEIRTLRGIVKALVYGKGPGRRVP
jgi:tRNA/rRNA methyltransferase